MEESHKLDLGVRDITSINTLLELFEPNRGLLKNFLLFRGQTKDHGGLNPSIFRYGQDHTRNIEHEIYSDFYSLIRNYPAARDMRNPWELLCYAQHIGVPTRLLDWTINPLIAAYFAVEDAYDSSDDGVVYVLNVSSFDRKSKTQRLGFRGHTLDGLPQDLEFLKPLGGTTSAKNSPPSGNAIKIIQPPILDARMQAQAALFSVNLYGTEPHDMHFGEHWRSYRIPFEAKTRIQTQLYRMGVHAASVYPDAEGIGRYLKYRRNREYHES